MRYNKLTRRRQDRIRVSSGFENGFDELDRTSVPLTELAMIQDCEALYKGGVHVLKRLHYFMPEPDLMSKKSRRIMLSIASVKYTNQMASVVNFFPDFLFSFPLVFKTPSGAFFDEFKEDCDGSGTDLHDFVKLCFIEYLVGKRVAVAVTLPRVPAVASLAEAESSGALRATVRRFGSTEIMDWELDSTRSLEWVILSASTVPRLSPESDGETQYEQYWVYTKNTLDYYEFKAGSFSASDEVRPLWSWQHGLGIVPVVLAEAHDGIWLGGKLRNPCVDHWRAKTALGFHNNKTAYPVLVKSSADTSSTVAIGESSVQIGEKDKLDFLVPPSDSREALENEVTDSKKAIYSTANLLFLVDQEKNKPWRSARAKESDSEDGAVTMKGYGSTVRNFAKSILSVVDRVRGGTGKGFDVSGFEKLDEMSLDQFAVILQTLSTVDFTVIEGFGQTARKNLMKRAIALALSDVDEATKQTIHSEIDKSKPVKPEPVAKQENTKEGK